MVHFSERPPRERERERERGRRAEVFFVKGRRFILDKDIARQFTELFDATVVAEKPHCGNYTPSKFDMRELRMRLEESSHNENAAHRQHACRRIS
jgi:hypothetical protein